MIIHAHLMPHNAKMVILLRIKFLNSILNYQPKTFKSAQIIQCIVYHIRHVVKLISYGQIGKNPNR
jgi:hypothetical protein